MYLIYESFFNKRYHLMVRSLLRGKDRFSEGVEIGFDTCNDNSPSAAVLDGKVIVCWENSSPLYTEDYQWENSDGDIITMPSFGHGWRVETKIGIRRISVENKALVIESPDGEDLWNGESYLGLNESSGMPLPLVYGDRLLVALVSYGGDAVCDLNFQYYTALCFRTIATGLCYPHRIQPSAFVSGEELVMIADSKNGGTAIGRMDMSLQTDCIIPAFRAVKKVRLNRLDATSVYVAPERFSVEYNGEKLNIYWGDLHSHSNISKCSLHPMFHCTEVNEKHRFSRDVGRLDFMLLTDHQTMSGFEWHQTQKYAHLSNNDGSFTSFADFEWSSSQQKRFHNYGHYNILYRDSGDLLPISEEGFHDIRQVWNHFKKGEALTIPHHSGDIEHPLDWNFLIPILNRPSKFIR